MCLFSISSFSNTKEKKQSKISKPMITWKQEFHDLGKIRQGKPVTVKFNFKNTSSQPLLITKVKTSCGCTATNYPKTEIKPGEESVIELTYNARNKGAFHKTAYVSTNQVGLSQKLAIKGNVY